MNTIYTHEAVRSEVISDAVISMNSDGDRKLTKPKSVIYLVEDDDDDRMFAKRTLNKSDNVEKVVTHSSAEELFNYLTASGAYDMELCHELSPVILLDIHMPSMGGIEALTQIRMHPLTEATPVAILTSDMSSDLVFDAYKLKANAFLQKPLRLAHFHDFISTGWGWPMKSP